MELMTEEIKKEFLKVGSQDGAPAAEHICVVKFFDPTGSWTWYATEFDGFNAFFGLVDGAELEWGPFLLSELQEFKGPFGIGIERDLYSGFPKKLGEVTALNGRL